MKTTSQKSMKAQSRNEQSGSEQTPATVNTPVSQPIQLPLPRFSIRERHTNRALPTVEVLRLLRTEAPRFWELAEVVGRWVWIQFHEKQPREVTAALSRLGFHWNRRRQCWQHPCGTVRPFDPRRAFGSYFPADQQPA